MHTTAVLVPLSTDAILTYYSVKVLKETALLEYKTGANLPVRKADSGANTIT